MKKNTEAQLYATKWFDHKLLQPDIATMQFIRYWIESHSWALRHAGLDHVEDAVGNAVQLPYPYTSGLPVYFQRVNGGKDWAAFQKLRRLADRDGLPYWLMCETAIRVMLGTDHARLEVTYAVEQINLSSIMLTAREQFDQGPIQFARDPFFAGEHFTGWPLQRAYCSSIVDRVKTRYHSGAVDVLRKLVERGKMPIKFFHGKKLLTSKTDRVDCQ